MDVKAISVVLAAYNGQDYLPAQLASIFPQLQAGDELLISLDPSSDQSQDIVEQFLKAHSSPAKIRLLQGPGQGVIHNFESALSQVQNPIVVLCDQDDVWMDNKLACIRHAFSQNPTLAGFVHDALLCTANLEVMAPSFFAYHHSKSGFVANLLRNSFIGCCMAIRKEVVEQSLPFPTIPMHDQFLGLQALRAGEVEFYAEPLLYYRRHDHNASSLKPASPKQQVQWRLQLLQALAKRPIKRIANH